MRTFLVVAVLLVLAVVFIAQKRNTPAPSAVTAHTEESRPVSEHDWAKHALDKTAKVRQDVQRQRAGDAP